jgi:hypothetical protein
VSYRWVQKDVGGTIYTDELAERPDASPTFAVLSPSGGSLGTGTGTVDSVNTTLSAGAAAGATSVSVTSATGVTVGRRYLVGGTEETGGEWATVASIASTTVTLSRPLVRAQASGAAFQGTRVSCAVTAAMAATIYRGCRCEITYAVSSAARPVVAVEFDVTRYRLTTGLTLDHVRDLDPTITKRAATGTVWARVIDAAWERIVNRVGLQKDPGGLVGAIDLTQPHAIAVRLLIAEQSLDEDGIARATELRTRLDTELAAQLAARAYDDDQDGAIESHEGWYRTINLTRG